MPRLLSGSGIFTREARSFTLTSIQPIRASTTTIMSHFTALGSFSYSYSFVFDLRGGRASAPGPAGRQHRRQRALRPSPGAGVPLGRCFRPRQSGQGRCPCGHSSRKSPPVQCGLQGGSPARQSCRWAARACPDRPFRRGSRRRNRSPRTRSPARWHCPRER